MDSIALQTYAQQLIAKALPTQGDVHVDRPLGNISVAYSQSADEFVASKVFGEIPAAHKSDKYYTYPKGYMYRSEAEERAPGTPSAGMGYALSTDDFVCKEYGLHIPVADAIQANADEVLNLEQDATQILTHQMLLLREIVWASTYFVTGAWTNETTPGTLWDAGGSTPVVDIRTQITARHKATGKRPNTLVLGAEVWGILQDHTSLTGRMPTTSEKIVTRQLLARLLELDNVYVMGAVQNTANENATDVMDFIGGKHALLCYSEPNPGKMKVSAGYTFTWAGRFGAGSNGFRMKRFRNEDNEAWKIEVQAAFVHKKVADDCGHFFLSVIS